MDKCNKCGSTSIIGIEYEPMTPEVYDGVSEWLCNDCGQRIGRWTSRVLKDGEIENRYGRKDG